MKISTPKLKPLPLNNLQPPNPLMPVMGMPMLVIAMLKTQVKEKLPMELIPKKKRMRMMVRRLTIRDWRPRILNWS